VEEQQEAQPESTADGGDDVAAVAEGAVSSGGGVPTRVVVARQIRGHRQPLEIDGLEGRFIVRDAQRGKRLSPRPSIEQAAGTVECFVRRRLP
jgi:hypothetical protein